MAHGVAGWRTKDQNVVLLCLHEKGLVYDLHPVDLAGGAHKQPPYLSLNPFGQIPALEDGKVSLFECRPNLLRSNSLSKSALVETWMEVEAHRFNGPISEILRQIPCMGWLERFSKSKYLAGESYSLVDLHHIPTLVYFMTTPKANAITSRLHVNAWWNDISSRPATIEVSTNMKL
ncbi:hypothetical protein I3842_01G148300 [Carya illinoinensis]|uniref:glutathione transferase n=1 Tax=Carya illinoinensis TaxID=32201 RepID=A0A922K5M7_CARIL|nr:hypothetical protein I3842_01G148300 [Carya illinoinensis]